MAFFDQSKPVNVSDPQTAVPLPGGMPTVREMRAEAVHRLQVGLFGLAGMLLLVGLANIIMDRAQLADDAAAGTEAAITAALPSPSETAAKDPLVDMGVAPELPTADKAGQTAKPGSN
jgi:hypothetical protein